MLYHYREMPGQGQPFRNSVDMIAYLRGPKSTGERIENTTHNWISKYWYYGKHPNHPAEKDAELVETLLDWCSDPGDVVLDPFMGSGTVGVACINTERRFQKAQMEQLALTEAT
jgi:DNA modification methylase